MPSSNEERVVRCPVDGCEHEGLSRGMHLHIRQSSGGGHGPHGDVPEKLDLDNLEEVGTKNVQLDYPESRSVDTTARLCPYCGQAFRGYQGVKIHLGQKRGKGVHSSDTIDDIDIEDCPVAKVDEDMNVIEVVEENALMPSTKRRIQSGQESVPIEKVQQFIQWLENDGENEIADRARQELLA
jgi:hypothetical protein